jgi:hypothetical protein
MVGVGVPPIEVSSQSFAVTDGAQFQRQRAGQRKFSLTAKPIVGTSLADFHNVRRTIFDAFKPDLTTAQQPVRFLYYGAQGTQQIDAYYEKGLELGNMDGVIAENAAISFVATDPYFYAPTQQGTTLPARVFLGSVNYMARRSPLGQWGTMGQTSGTTLQASGSHPHGNPHVCGQQRRDGILRWGVWHTGRHALAASRYVLPANKPVWHVAGRHDDACGGADSGNGA